MENLTTGLAGLTVEQIPVYLLKTKSSPSDSYETHFWQLDTPGRYLPVFVPVLEHLFRDDALRTLRRSAERFAFASGSEATARHKATANFARKYSGIIFTSQRAVDAFASVVGRLDPAKKELLFDRQMPLYVVGPATAQGVRALQLPCTVLGEETGSGEALAQFIQTHHATVSSDVTHLHGNRLPLLFLVGEQRRDIIPKTLQDEALPPANRIPVTEVVVYETGEMAEFEQEFGTLLRQAKAAKAREQWVVVFSPQGCEAMLNALGWLDEKTGTYDADRRGVVSGPLKTKVVTIGPTTRDHLVETLKFEPDACAAQPSPEGVGEAILTLQNA